MILSLTWHIMTGIFAKVLLSPVIVALSNLKDYIYNLLFTCPY